MTISSARQPASAAGGARVLPRLLPIVLAVFIGFLTLGLPLPVLPLHLRDAFALSPPTIGAVLGAQFAAALLTRAWAGGLTDTRGARRAMIAGLVTASLAGVAYLVSLSVAGVPASAVAWIVAGRVLLGAAESLVVTGALSWGMMLAGPANAGKVMAWVGIAMYAAYAGGAPAGVALYGPHGFAGIAVATIALPLVALACLVRQPAVPPAAARRTPFYKVVGAVWLPGLGLALCSVGFGVITTFGALLFAARGWGSASLAFTAFGVAFIGARLLFGHLPDRIGGARVALVCVLVEVAGQLLIWVSASAPWACVGAALTGFGYSLAFPGFGVEAVRRAPPQSRGAAMGAYVAFLDLSLGLAAPLAGAVASAGGVGSVYQAGAGAVALSAIVAVVLLRRGPAA